MTIARYRRADAIDHYLTRKTKSVEKRWSDDQKTNSLTIQPEPSSARYVTSNNVEILQIENEDDPIRARVVSHFRPTWRPEGLDVIRKLRALKIDLEKMARTGGPYLSNYPMKRLRNWKQNRRHLDQAAIEFWQRPWWSEKGRPLYERMLQYEWKKTLDNIDTIDMDHDLAVGEKRETTGTGWRAPSDTRGGIRDNIAWKKKVYQGTVNSYYQSMLDAVHVWPEYGSIITIGPEWKGISSGSRSDADVIQWLDDNTQIVSASAREVGTDPSSTFHNQKLNDKSKTIELWRSISPPCTLLPFTKESFLEAYMYPPLTVDWAHEEIEPKYNLSADFGYTDQKLSLEGKYSTMSKETVKFGADQLVLSGIYLLSDQNQLFAHMISGCPFTMLQYNILDWGIYEAAKQASLSLQILSVGDDKQILGSYDALKIVLQDMGPWLRVKGMTGNIVFILGHYVYWVDPEHVMAWVFPRAMKTVASPKMAEGIDEATVGSIQDIPVSDEAEENETREWKDHGNYSFFDGTRDEWKEYLKKKFIADKLRASQSQEVSPWFADIINPSDVDM